MNKKAAIEISIGTIVLIVIALIIIFGVIIILQFTKDKLPIMTQQPVSYCSQDLSMKNQYNETINGIPFLLNSLTGYKAVEITNFSNLTFIYGVNYAYWIQSNSYVTPKEFTACIGTVVLNESKPKKSAEVKLYDALMLYQDRLVLRKEYDVLDYNEQTVIYTYKAHAFLRYYTSEHPFAPFGSMMIVEYPMYLNAVCNSYNSENLGTFYPGYHYSQTANNTYRVYSLANLDASENVYEDIHCQFGFSNEDNIPYINNSLIKFIIIPQNYFVAQDEELILDVSKQRDNNFSLTGFGETKSL